MICIIFNFCLSLVNLYLEWHTIRMLYIMYLYFQVIESALDSKIIGQLDKSGSGFIYTESYIKRFVLFNSTY